MNRSDPPKASSLLPQLRPIPEVAHHLGLQTEDYDLFGSFKAKLTSKGLARLTQPNSEQGKLILVTAMSPTPAGEGKTTQAIGLGDGLNRLGQKAVVCLREPSLGPTFGMKGGATGGGRAQIAPQDDINLHFTGDFHAVGAAHNLLAALIDNHIYHGNELDFDVRRITWRRVMDMNDRALRELVVGLGGSGNGYPRESGFDIVVASEVMAALCLSQSLEDLRDRLGSMIVGYSRAQKPLRAKELGGVGAMLVLLKDAFRPNLVQTLEGNPVLVHGGPFANIAHGCNSVLATRIGLRLGRHVVTEAGFGADLGAEKFINIKCRSSGLRPDVAVLVATLRAIKFHGLNRLPKDLAELRKPDLQSLNAGLVNVERHFKNLTENFNLPTVISINSFDGDSAEELDLVVKRMASLGAKVIPSRHWAEGGAGAEALAKEVLAVAKNPPSRVRLLYPDEMPLTEKIKTIATRLYGASEVYYPANVMEQLETLQKEFGHFPICIAKTQSSFSSQASLRGAPSNHRLDVREVRLAAGAGFVVVICGEILTMPGLPKVPAALGMDISPE